MGYAMATNLIKAGYSVTVWNRTAEKCDALAAAGAATAVSPAEVRVAALCCALLRLSYFSTTCTTRLLVLQVMENCDVTIAMLADPEAALQVGGTRRRRDEEATHGHLRPHSWLLTPNVRH